MNINDFIGLPYQEGARGPDAYDCYGIVAAVIRAARGVELPDWYKAGVGQQAASEAISAALRGEVIGGRSTRTDEPENLDIAVVCGSGGPHHVGVVFDGGVLHASKATGSVWQPFSRFTMLYPKVEYYKWQL